MSMSALAAGLGEVEKSHALTIVSETMGWVYFTAWSVSFFPQFILNWQRKSTVGLSYEYLAYNLTGFFFYSLYSTVNFVVQHKLHLAESVHANDVAFGVFATVMTLATIVQVFIYERGGQTIDRRHLAFMALLWVVFGVFAVLSCAGVVPWYATSDQGGLKITTMQYLGVVKAVISFVKCVPQAYLNYTRQSTVGWSIINILLDITGGSLSFGQNFIDAYNASNWALLYSNIPKLLLSIVTIIFDLVFLTQHYVLYTNRDEHEPLLVETDESYGKSDGGDTSGLRYQNNEDGVSTVQIRGT
jgi:cystinosin